MKLFSLFFVVFIQLFSQGCNNSYKVDLKGGKTSKPKQKSYLDQSVERFVQNYNSEINDSVSNDFSPYLMVDLKDSLTRMSILVFSDSTCNFYTESGAIVYGLKTNKTQKIAIQEFFKESVRLSQTYTRVDSITPIEIGQVKLYLLEKKGMSAIALNSDKKEQAQLKKCFRRLLAAFHI